MVWAYRDNYSIIIGAASYVSAGQACLGGAASCNTTTDVQVTLTGWDICIGSDTGFNFGTFTVSTQAQTTSGVFSGNFYVDDQKGSNSGYYTTVQIANLVNGSNTIPANAVSFRSSSVSANDIGLSPLSGGALAINSRVKVSGDVLNTWGLIDTPKEYIMRNNAANFGIIGRYGEKPFLQLIIPAYTPVGNYHGNLTYTLYEPGR